MKKILIVEVPEGYEILPYAVTAHKNKTYERVVCNFTEFTPPTADAADAEAKKTQGRNPDYIAGWNDCYEWVISKIDRQ